MSEIVLGFVWCNLVRNICDEICVMSVSLLVHTQVCVMDMCDIKLCFGFVCLYKCLYVSMGL